MRYYSRIRPLEVGTVPKYSDNKVLKIVSSDTPKEVKWSLRGKVYGYVEYKYPIPNKDVDEYELVPDYKPYFQCLSLLYHNLLSSNPELDIRGEISMSFDDSMLVSKQELLYLEDESIVDKYYTVSHDGKYQYMRYVDKDDESIYFSAARVWDVFTSRGLEPPVNKDTLVLSALLDCPVWEFVRDYLEFDLINGIWVSSVLGHTLKGKYSDPIHSLFVNTVWSEHQLPVKLAEDIANPNLRLVNDAITRYCMNDNNELCRVSTSTRKRDLVRADVIDPDKYGVVEFITDIDNLLSFDVEDIYILSRNPKQMFFRKCFTSPDYIVVFV